MAEVADARGDFGVRTSRVLLLHEVQGLDEGRVVGVGGLLADGDTCGGCEQFGFGVVEVEAQRGAQAGECLQEGDNVQGV